MKLEMEKANCREKDSEIRDLKEKIVKLVMEKTDCREKDLEIRDLKKEVVKLVMEEADCREKVLEIRDLKKNVVKMEKVELIFTGKCMAQNLYIQFAFSFSNFTTFSFKSLIFESFSL